MVVEMQNITDVVHDVRTNRNFSRRVTEGRIEEFHQFGEDFNSLLDEMEEWQLKLQAKTLNCCVPPCTIRSRGLQTAPRFATTLQH